MKTNVKPHAQRRRDFMKLAVVTGGVAAVAGGTEAALAAEESDVTVEPKRKKGYQLTEHVQEYYNKARF